MNYKEPKDSPYSILLSYAKSNNATREELKIINQIKSLNECLEKSDLKLDKLYKIITQLEKSDPLNAELETLNNEMYSEFDKSDKIIQEYNELFFSDIIMNIIERETERIIKERNAQRIQNTQKRLSTYIYKKKHSFVGKIFEKDYKKEKIAFLRILIEELIIEYENQIYPSCASLLLQIFDKTTKGKESQAKNWNDTFDYEFTAYKFIYNYSFDLLCSGRYHIYAGELNPVSPALNLHKLCKVCLDFYVDNNFITVQQKEEQLKLLYDRIKQI